MQIRLQELRQEFEIGQRRLHDLEMQQATLRETLLRISGAIQVLEEMLTTANKGTSDGAQPRQLERGSS